MPSFPQPGTVTICEINRELVTAENLGDDQAKETYAKILGTVFSPIQFESDVLLGTGTENEQVERRKGSSGIFAAGLEAVLSGSLRPLLQPADVKLLSDIDLHSVSWHNHKQILAFISAQDQVTICDYNDSDGKIPSILSHESQKDVKILEWRPNGGKTLSVACKGGICIWAASYPGNVPSVRSGVTSNPLSRGVVTRWTLVDFLRSSDSEQISALSWSPDGRYLASASYESSSFTIWDVSQGLGTPIRRGLGGISLLKWSPSGDYFFSAKFDGTFYLWETNSWTSEPWSSKNGFVTVDSYDFVFNTIGRNAGRKIAGATWDPDGSMILLSFSESSSLGSIHFTSKPPSLDAHLIPVELPEIKLLTDSKVIKKIAWDASGERLAVSYRDGDEMYKGLIAVFDVKRAPLVSTSLVGFIRGPGDNPKPIAFSFHNKFKEGPLLSVIRTREVYCKLTEQYGVAQAKMQAVVLAIPPKPIPEFGFQSSGYAGISACVDVVSSFPRN